MSRWRLLIDDASSGPWNMGVDEALLVSAASGQPALRLYRWQGPWLSLGYAQSLDAERRRALARCGVGVVRRVTGGGAVLHGADLTYSVVAPLALVPGDLRAVHVRIARGLRAGLESLGLALECAEGRRVPRAFDCFAASAPGEILREGRKLCGSAQRRGRRSLLQHGSIRLGPDPAGAARAAGLDPKAAASLLELGVDCAPEAVAEALVKALEAALEARFEPSTLTQQEAENAGKRGPEPPRAWLLHPQEAF